MKEYIKSKFKLFKFQKNDLALINDNLKDILKKFSSKLIPIKDNKYKNQIKNQ